MRAIYHDAARAAWIGLLVNLVLAVAKLLGGVISGSFALISDAVNSTGDVLTSTVVIVALHIAQRPADANHPYGHTRAEGIAASNVALLIIVSAAFVGWEALRRFGRAQPVPPLWALWIAGCNVAIKEALYHYKMRVGRRTGSAALIANAWDHRSDALCALAVLIGLALVRWGGPQLGFADSLAALIVGGAIVAAGVSLLHTSANELMDAQAEADVIEAVRGTAATVGGVRAVEQVRVRKTGLEHLADIHVQVAPHLSVADGHRISHHVKNELMDRIPTLRDVMVHLEPVSPNEGLSANGSDGDAAPA